MLGTGNGSGIDEGDGIPGMDGSPPGVIPGIEGKHTPAAGGDPESHKAAQLPVTLSGAWPCGQPLLGVGPGLLPPPSEIRTLYAARRYRCTIVSLSQP